MKARFLLAAAAFVCAVFTAEAFDSFKDAFQAARKAKNEKNYEESLKILKEAKSLAQNQGQKYQVSFFCAEIYYWNKKDLKNAVSNLDEIISNEESTDIQKANALTQKANYLKWKGKKPESEKLYKKAMELNVSGDARQNTLNGYADLLRSNKKYDEAEKLYQESIAVEKGVPYHVHNAKLGLARIAAQKKEYDKALELFNDVIKIPKGTEWIAESACRDIIDKVYIPQKKYAEAAEFLDKLAADESFSKSMKTWISDSRIRINLAAASDLIREKKFDEAAEKIKAADAFQTKTGWLNQYRASVKANLEIERGNGFRKEKKYAEAIETFKKVLDIKNAPDYSKHAACLNIGNVLISLKKLDEAKEYIDKAIGLPKQNPNMQISGLHTLASYFLAKQNTDEAVASLEKAVAITGKVDAGWKAYAYKRLAEIFYRKKDFAKADEYIKKCMAVPNAKWGKDKGLENRIKKALEQNQ